MKSKFVFRLGRLRARRARMGLMPATDGDHVDEILTECRRACPTVDSSPIGVTGRVTRIALYLDRSTDNHLEPYRLTRSGFEVLVMLRGTAAHHLSPTRLARTPRMSSAGITALVDQLASLGLVGRSPDPHDRRRVLVSLTRRGGEMGAMAGRGGGRNEHSTQAPLG